LRHMMCFRLERLSLTDWEIRPTPRLSRWFVR
jgi:hypothetical protein